MTLPTGKVVLRDGRSLRLRPIRPDDKKRLEEFFYRLSPRSRYLRFQFPKTSISEQELAHYTDVTPPQGCAYVATRGEGEKERIVAVGRWDTLPDGRSAEVAFAVEDQLQMQGVGTALLEQLATAAIRFNIQRFVAQVLVENTTMLDVFERSGFKTTKRLEQGIYYCDIDLTQQDEFARQQAYREHVARAAGIRHLLCPRSIAVIGASRDPRKIGGALFRNLLQGGFTGPVFPVNPNVPSVAGVLAYPTILDVPGDVDLAVIAVPAPMVLEVVDQCAMKGVWGLVIISAGFGETGGEGMEREKALREKVLSYGMRLIGPNCLGVLNTHADVSMNATFAPVVPPPGKVSMASQSGALGIALLDYARAINLGMAYFVSMGNKVDVSSNDLLEFWEDDPSTSVILLYLESFGNPRKFSRIARRLTRTKPIIVVKGGRSAVGARATASHTGALAGTTVAVDALLRQAGVLQVDSIEELFGVAQVLAHQPPPKGNRVAIVTNAGGPGILAADAAEAWGLNVTPLAEETRKRLRQFLPQEASVGNPVDMLASATPQHYQQTLGAVLEDPNVDSVIVIYIPPLVTHPEEVAAAVRQAVANYRDEKPVIACFMMARGAPEGLRLDSDRYIPSFVFPEDAVKAVAGAWEYAEYRERPEGQIVRFPDIDRDAARAFLHSSVEVSERGNWLPLEVAMRLFQMYGIPVAQTVAAGSPEEAAQAAQGLGFPVAMKVRSTTIVHKTDVGGVALDLSSADQVRQAYRDMASRLEALGRSHEMQGVVLQPMVHGGQEVIVGMSQDPLFGPLVMVGLGGVQVELIKDVAFSLHPLTDLDPDRMLGQLKSLPLLTGWRGSPPRDVAALKEVLLRFSALIEDFPEISEMEVNPLLVFDRGRGCAALDARIMVKQAP